MDIDSKLEDIKTMQNTLKEYETDIHKLTREELVYKFKDLITGYKGTLRGLKMLFIQLKIQNKLGKIKGFGK